MTFLPIVERELRVRARRWPTYWVRVIIGSIATLLCVQQLQLGEMISGAGQGGSLAFKSLVVVAFIICCFGCLATSDAISWERREKTLGLLFLTRVRGADILLGKLASGSIVMLCALVAFLPVLMIPVLAGGVTGGEAVRIGLMLVDTLMLSLAAGLLASTRHEQWFKSARAAVLILTALLLLPVIGQVLFHPLPVVGLLSPLYGVTFADQSGPAFWISLALVQLMVWLLFSRALLQIRWSLRDAEGTTQSNVQPNRPGWAPQITVAIRPLCRVGARPIGWLLRRQRGIVAMVWAAAILSFLFYGIRSFIPMFGAFAGPRSAAVWPMSFAGAVISGSLFAWAASRFFFEARRSGELELLVTTPVGAKTMVWEQWLFLRRALRWPLVILLLPMPLQFLVVVLPRYSFSGNQWVAWYGVSTLFSSVNVILSLVALCWTGMWCGLKSPTQALAVFRCVLWVTALPYLLNIVWALLANGLVGPASTARSIIVNYAVLSWVPQFFMLGYYIWLIRRMRRRLLGEIRNAEALPFGWSTNLPSKPRNLGDLFRRVRHWTPS